MKPRTFEAFNRQCMAGFFLVVIILPSAATNQITVRDLNSTPADKHKFLELVNENRNRILNVCRVLFTRLLAVSNTSQIMKPQQTIETQCGCPRNSVKWGRAVGFGIAIGTVLGTVVGVATKNGAFIYIGLLLGAAIGVVFKSKETKSG